MTIKFSLVTTALGTGALMLGYGLHGLWVGALVVLTLGLLWLLDQWRGWGWMASIALISFVGTAAVGLWLGLGSGWMLFGVAAALGAWDLDRFARRLRSVRHVAGRREVERCHLRRLLGVGGLGLGLGGLALGVKVELGFGTALLLGLLIVLGLSRAVGFLRRESD